MISIALHTQLSETIAKKSDAITGATAIRPSQLIFSSPILLSASSAQKGGDHLPRHQHGESPARQQLEVPADDHAREDREPVDDRVQDGPHPAVLARRPRQEAVHVVPHRDQPEDRGRPGVAAVAGGEREVEEDGQAGEPQVADGVRDRPWPQGLSRPCLARRRPRTVEPELTPEALSPPLTQGLFAAPGHEASIWKARRKPASHPRALRTSLSGSRASSATRRSRSSTTSAARW